MLFPALLAHGAWGFRGCRGGHSVVELRRDGVLCRLPSGIGRLQFLSAGCSQADRSHPGVAGRVALNPTPLLKESRAPRQRRALDAKSVGQAIDRSPTAQGQHCQHRKLRGAQAMWPQVLVEETREFPCPSTGGQAMAIGTEAKIHRSIHEISVYARIYLSRGVEPFYAP